MTIGDFMRNLVVATRNKDKYNEIKTILFRLPVRFSYLVDYPSIPPIEENGASLVENAIKKASSVYNITGEWCIADDTGLFVDILDGAPGLYSARFAGEDAGYEDNRYKLLRKLSGVPGDKRGARFVCCVAFCWNHGTEIFKGIIEGYITRKEMGDSGFGYDSIFVPSGGDVTFAELSPIEKNRISHRAIALHKFMVRLEELVN